LADPAPEALQDAAPAETPPPAEPAPPPYAARRPRAWPGWLKWLLAALALAVLAVLIWRLVFGHKKPAPAPPPTPVGVARVATGDMDVELSGIGTVTPDATVTVQSQVSGILFKVGFKEGQIVPRGHLLALIDPRPYEWALAQAQAALVRDTAIWGQAKMDYQRFALLLSQNSIARQQAEDQAYIARQAEGTVMLDKAAVGTAKLNLEYTRVLAPVTGRVGLRLVDPGNYIQVGQATALAVVTQLQPITVIFVLPQDDVPAVAGQMRQGGELQVSAWDRTNASKLADGTLITIDNTADTTTGTVKLRASFPNRDFPLFPNQFVNARLKLRTLKGVTIVSVRAIQHGTPGTFVYLLQPGGVVRVRVIRTGVSQGDEVQVLSGLNVGDTVVVDGVDRLRDGAHVRIVPESAVGAPRVNTGPGAPPGEQPQNARPGAGGGRRRVPTS
jgi:multidrug efflux system membrane fusion protein